jgi:uncharacterized protein HemX
MENSTLSATADAAQVVTAVGGLTPMGFLQVILTIIVLGIIWLVWHIMKDRKEVRKERDEWQKNHEQLHAAEKDTLKFQVEDLKEDFTKLETKVDAFSIVLNTMSDRMVSIQASLENLSGQFTMYMKMRGN